MYVCERVCMYVCVHARGRRLIVVVTIQQSPPLDKSKPYIHYTLIYIVGLIFI